MIDLSLEQHDFFISALLNGLRVFNGRSPPFGAAILIELHEHNETAANWNERSSIAMFYLNDTTSEIAHPLRIPECLDVEHCTVKQFATSVSDLALSREQWVKECHDEVADDDQLADYNPLLGKTYRFNKGDLIKGVCLIVVATLGVVFVILIAINFIKERRHDNRAFKQKLLK